MLIVLLFIHLSKQDYYIPKQRVLENKLLISSRVCLHIFYTSLQFFYIPFIHAIILPPNNEGARG